MKVTSKFTLYPVMLPSSIMTFWSLIQAPSTFLKVLVALSMPCRMASSKPSSETALISVTLATLILLSHPFLGTLASRVYVLCTMRRGKLNELLLHMYRGHTLQRTGLTSEEETSIRSGSIVPRCTQVAHFGP